MAFMKKIKRMGRQVQKLILDRCCSIEREPVIVLGNQKSGTTAIAALIGKAAGRSVILDFFFRVPRSGRKIIEGRSSLREFIDHNKSFFSKQVIKDPDLTFLLPEVLTVYPRSKMVFILRDPIANVRSILSRLGLPGTIDLLSEEQRREIEKSLPEWYDVLDGKRFGHKDANPVMSLLKRAIKSHEICAQNVDKLIVVRYEDFLTDKQNYIEGLCDTLNLSVENDIKKDVDVQYQPKGTRGSNLADFFGHENLKRMQQLLSQPEVQKCLERNGYTCRATD
jgi:hypothetical protein